MQRLLVGIVIGLVLVAAPLGAALPRTGHVSVTTGAAVEIGNASNRYSLIIGNNDTTNPIFCGSTSAVTSSTGKKIAAGGALTIASEWQGVPTASNSFFCISTGGTVDTDFLEAVK